MQQCHTIPRLQPSQIYSFLLFQHCTYPSTPPFSSASLIQDRSWAGRYTGCQRVHPGWVANVADIERERERERLLFTLTLTPTANLGSPVNPCMWEEAYMPPGPMQERSVWPSLSVCFSAWFLTVFTFKIFEVSSLILTHFYGNRNLHQSEMSLLQGRAVGRVVIFCNIMNEILFFFSYFYINIYIFYILFLFFAHILFRKKLSLGQYWGLYINTSYMLLKYILPPVCCMTMTEMDAVLLSLISAA